MKYLSATTLMLISLFLWHPIGYKQSNQHNSSMGAPIQSTPKLTPNQIFESARSSVVVILATDQDEKEHAQGSGFVVGQNRVVTNHHVLQGMSRASVLFSDGKIQSVTEIIADSADQDLIILGAETGQRRPLPLGDELSLKEGDGVYAIGAPEGLELSFTNGIVSSFRQSSSQFLIQSTAPIAPGSSGGPLLDGTGHVVGITTSRITDAPGIYFSVASSDVKRLMRTPSGVTLTFANWAKQQGTRSADSPSLEETIAWMLDFSKRHRKVTQTTSTIQYDSFEEEQGCDVRISHMMTNLPKSVPVGSVDTFRLKDIDPVKIYISNSSDVNLFTSKNAPLIHRSLILSHNSSMISMDHISFDSKENAERFAEAFRHAVAVCESIKEPF